MLWLSEIADIDAEYPLYISGPAGLGNYLKLGQTAGGSYEHHKGRKLSTSQGF